MNYNFSNNEVNSFRTNWPSLANLIEGYHDSGLRNNITHNIYFNHEFQQIMLYSDPDPDQLINHTGGLNCSSGTYIM